MEDATRICPTHPYWLVNAAQPQIRVPAGCKSYRCAVCRPVKIRERIKLAAWGASRAHVLRMVTLTQIPEPWQLARQQVRDFLRRLRRSGTVEWAWTIERNPRGTGYHAHALSHGDYMRKELMRERWGGRFVDVRRVAATATGYLAKCQQLAGYQQKDADKHLEINGGRAIHMTRGYLHGRTAREALQEMSTGEEWYLSLATVDEIRSTTMVLGTFKEGST